MPPAMGLRPLDPHFPTPVGLGFASGLGSTRGGVANAGNSPPFGFWGHIPQTPRHGGFAPLGPRWLTLVG